MSNIWMDFSTKFLEDPGNNAVLGSLVVGGAVVVWWGWKTTRGDESVLPGIPHLSPKWWKPFVGWGDVYFQSTSKFSVQYASHGTFTMTMFGKTWLRIYEPRDVLAYYQASDQTLSLLAGYQDLAGFALPKQAKSTIPKHLYNILGEHVSNTPLILHSVRPPKIQAWIPLLRTVLQQSLDNLPATPDDDGGGTLDLFPWCQDIISAVTVRVLLGDAVADKPEVLRKFVKLFHEADPESGFVSPTKAMITGLEVAFRGERQIYPRVRELLFPLIDQAMDLCVREGNVLKDDASVLASFVQGMYERKLHCNKADLREARIRIANDIFNFSFAAFSNSFGMAGWIIFHMLRNTNGMGDSLRQELLETGSSTAEALSTQGWPRLEAAILEVGRLYSPGDVHRMTLKPWKLPSTGTVIPKGISIVVSPFTNMRNEEHFANPLAFDVDRYNSERQEHKSILFAPFGAGAHTCPGKRFAVLEIAMFVTEAFRALDLELVPDASWGTDDFTNQSVLQVDQHPPLDPSQPNFIWRPVKPILIKYKKKQQ